jgi:hypothetical protein
MAIAGTLVANAMAGAAPALAAEHEAKKLSNGATPCQGKDCR